MSDLTIVLVHGSGHTARVWEATQSALSCPSLAVDLPGRAARPADITRVTIDEAAEAIAADVCSAVAGDVVLAGHSAAGIVLPAAAARLGSRVRHLVFVASITAADGELPLEVFMPGQADAVAAQVAAHRRRHGGRTLESIDVKTAGAIESLNLSSQRVSWDGVPATLGRTFIRCLRDPIQPREIQARFIANCGATEVIDMDTGHTPAIEAPAELAAVLDRIVASC